MIKLKRTTSEDEDFIALVEQLDTYLAVIDGDEHAFYNQFNKIDKIKHVIIAYQNDTAIGCGAIKELASNTMEVKRMFTSPAGRKKGVATTVLAALEEWASELGYKVCVLETGIKQADAISLYHKCGYQSIPNYGQYVGIENSVCFEKEMK